MGGGVQIDRQSRGIISISDLIDAVRIERDLFFDLLHRFKWRFIRPHCIDRVIPADGDAAAGSVAFKGARSLRRSPARINLSSLEATFLNRVQTRASIALLAEPVELARYCFS
jgi:hypothetical protein